VTTWTIGDFLYQMNSQNITWDTLPISSAHLAELIYLFDQGKITASNAKIVLGEMMQTGDRPSKVVADRGFVLQSDAVKLSELAKDIVAQNPVAASDYHSGKEQALSFLLGKMLQETKGQADPTTARQALKNILDS
jgi:aspartyl-tRNA(Asn)/glutamyl-tRNA(Gln) amidotransferase subunit B